MQYAHRWRTAGAQIIGGSATSCRRWPLAPAGLHACMRVSTHERAPALARTHAHTHTHTHTDAHTPTRARTHAHTHAHTDAHTPTRARTHAHTQAHTHAHRQGYPSHSRARAQVLSHRPRDDRGGRRLAASLRGVRAAQPAATGRVGHGWRVVRKLAVRADSGLLRVDRQSTSGRTERSIVQRCARPPGDPAILWLMREIARGSPRRSRAMGSLWPDWAGGCLMLHAPTGVSGPGPRQWRWHCEHGRPGAVCHHGDSDIRPVAAADAGPAISASS